MFNAGLARHICHMVKVNFGIRIIKIDCWRQNALVYGHGAGYQLGKALPRPSSGLSRPLVELIAGGLGQLPKTCSSAPASAKSPSWVDVPWALT